METFHISFRAKSISISSSLYFYTHIAHASYSCMTWSIDYDFGLYFLYTFQTSSFWIDAGSHKYFQKEVSVLLFFNYDQAKCTVMRSFAPFCSNEPKLSEHKILEICHRCKVFRGMYISPASILFRVGLCMKRSLV